MKYAIVDTAWGTVLFAAGSGGLKHLLLPLRASTDPHAVGRRRWPGADYAANMLPQLQTQIRRFFSGEPTHFRVKLDLNGRSEFHQHVLRACAMIPYGETLTYGQLAELARRPGAARAVGTAMAGNPIPLIIPCHRVVAAGGRLGGYSSPGGTKTKERLLQLEPATLHQ